MLSNFEHFASHDKAIESAKERIAVIDKDEIAEAFLYSLSTSLCEYRCPLLSYYYLISICPHEIEDYFYHNGKNLKQHIAIYVYIITSKNYWRKNLI